MAADKEYRLKMIEARLSDAAPFAGGAQARRRLEQIMKEVEDEFSGIPENPNAATSPPDGRMYPPNDNFEVMSNIPSVRVFRQLRHRTSFGDNGALRITKSDGSLMVDLAGEDGRFIGDLLAEVQNECH